MDIDIKNNEEESCFEAFVEGIRIYLGYSMDGNRILITTVQVPSELGGRGLGKKLSYKAIEYAIEKELKIVPICPFFEKCYERYKQQNK